MVDFSVMGVIAVHGACACSNFGLFCSCMLEIYICGMRMTYQYLANHLLLVSPLTVFQHRVLMLVG